MTNQVRNKDRNQFEANLSGVFDVTLIFLANLGHYQGHITFCSKITKKNLANSNNFHNYHQTGPFLKSGTF